MSTADPSHAGPRTGSARIVSWVVVGMTSWWLAFPLVIAIGLALVDEASGNVVGRSAAVALLWAGLGGAALAPVAGLVAAVVGRRRKAGAYFVGMGAVTVCCVLFILYALSQA
ncbi:hypothetical protein [Actinomadura geliboluensis]|uniref:hypothetical protein n=1 Tax=Actinomadura geliboluensis TaxID=882440 RepID=UPI0036AC6BAC